MIAVPSPRNSRVWIPGSPLRGARGMTLLPVHLLPQSHSLEPADNLVNEIRQLVEIVDQRDRDAGEAGFAEIGDLRRHVIWIAHDRQPAHALRIMAALREILLHRHGLWRNVLQRQDTVHGRPVGPLDDAMVEIVFGLLSGRPAGDDADRVTADFAALRARRFFGASNALS